MININKKDLLQFTSNNAAEEYINHVFRQDGYVVATDGHIMLRIPVGDVVNGDAIAEQSLPHVKSVIPTAFDKPTTLSIKKIKNAIKKAPMVDAQEECPECGGGGTVIWTYEGTNKDYEHEFRCPCCRGSGYIPTTGDKVPDPKQQFVMFDVYYATKDLQRLIRAITLCGVTQGNILHHEFHRIYIEAGPVQILLAGRMMDDYTKAIRIL